MTFSIEVEVDICSVMPSTSLRKGRYVIDTAICFNGL